MTASTAASRDQAKAATDHADAILEAVAAEAGASVHRGVSAPWVIQQVDALFRAIQTGEARLCPHVGPTMSPQPMSAAAWDPGRLCCAACAARLPALDPVEDARCDRCGHVVQVIFPGAVRAGAILLSWGLCAGCVVATGIPTHPGPGGR